MNLSRKILAQHQNPPAYAPHRGLLFGQFLSVGALVLGFARFASAQSVKRTPDDAKPQKPAAAQANPPAESDLLKNVKFGVTIEGYYEFNANRPPDRVLQLQA